MRTILTLCFLVLFQFLSAQQHDFLNRLPEFIENTSVFELNQEEGRAYFIPKKSLSLNGTWKFHFSDIPEDIPKDFFASGFNDKAWGNITVPSNWEMQGYGDKKFRNVSLTFSSNPPHVPKEYNPSGAYRLAFNIPSGWKENQIFLRFEKAASASFVWINGREVGYNEGAHEPFEFNITPYVKEGKNTLAVAVLKFCDGYYLEDQDYWRLAGIFDDVWLYATNNVRLFDWQIMTDLDQEYRNAVLTVKTVVKNYSDKDPGLFRLKAEVKDKYGSIVSEVVSNDFKPEARKNAKVNLACDVVDPKKWTAETPELYSLTLRLVAANGTVVDESNTRIGFKKTEIRGETFFLNDMPIKVNAMNSHMQHPETGHYVDEATIRKDLELLKQFSFNAVRTSHYPPTPKYLDLADEFGIYIIDEAGTETHSTKRASFMSEFKEMYKDRIEQMVLRDRNHPSVLFWSAGNESGQGPNIAEAIKVGKNLDPSRYWMYGGNGGNHPSEDIIGPRYPSPIELDMQIGIIPNPNEKRPSFMDEYLSVAGNGGGSLDEYWRAVYTHPRTMGGALWDFVSPGVSERIRLLDDRSPHHTPAHIMGNARLVNRDKGKALDLNGQDQWVEIYRQNNVELSGDKLTLTCEIFPRKLNKSSGTIITKGSYQFGLVQKKTDSLEFYLYTNRHYSLTAALPANWENSWHSLDAVYDGQEMRLFIDGTLTAKMKAEGYIQNFPFPINIGRNAEEQGQSMTGYLCDAQLDNVGVFAEAIEPLEIDSSKAALWLDFEKETDKGSFYSYGIGARTYGAIWPNRIPQPEMWQMKKTVQPVSIVWIDAEKSLIEVWNRNAFLSASHYKTTWKLQADDEVIEKGELNLKTAPLTKETIRLSLTKPAILPGKEYRITFSSTLRMDEIWAKAGHEVAWDQLELPWFQPLSSQKTVALKARIEKRNEEELTVTGDGFSYGFDLKRGTLASMQVKGKEILKEGIAFNVWRAPLANEHDEWAANKIKNPSWKTGFGNFVVTEMYSAGLHEMSSTLLSSDIKEVDGKIYLIFREISLMNDHSFEQKDKYIKGITCNGFENIYKYEISGNGEITLSHMVNPEGKMPLWLPCVGITMTLDKSLENIQWYGRGPQENYPDRKSGYAIGQYISTVQNMFEPYLFPQDFGLRTDNRWVSLTDTQGTGLRFIVNELFNFNAYEYSTENLTRAWYPYQLVKQDGITFNLDYATTGVGCSARSVFPAYRTYPQKYERTVRIIPVWNMSGN